MINNLDNKKITAIIPCFKYAKYLKECLDSIQQQTYPIHEIIVVDDGSPDGDEQQIIVNSYAGSKFPVSCIHKKNGGLSSARNAGISVSTGDYIFCLDADDKLTPGAIEEHVKLITDDKTIAQCALMEFEERYAVMIPVVPTNSSRLERTLQANTIFCNAMFPKQAWIDVGGFDESETMRLGYEDWEFWIRCLAKGYIVNTSDFIALRYRAHEGQMTQATSHPNAQILYKYIYNKHKDLYDKYDLKIAGMLLEDNN